MARRGRGSVFKAQFHGDAMTDAGRGGTSSTEDFIDTCRIFTNLARKRFDRLASCSHAVA